ncbi:MAG: LTA synthase family protein [Elusimicrobiota bacterium]|jgi:phosphoglycerol transferase MdoB-like AlkP superfamily enzyme|nr:LTA synthase family protein [Elusimicrobiota bacterium]
MKTPNIPRRFSAYLFFAFFNAIIFSLLRVVFYFVFPPAQALDGGLLAKAFYTGARFDLRLAFWFALPLGVIFLLPYKKWLKNFTAVFYTAAFLLAAALYAADFGYYAYLAERLNAYIFALAAEAGISLEMLWQSYPVVKYAFAFIIIAAVYYVFICKLLKWVYAKTSPKRHYWYALLGLIITFVFIWGRLAQYPLRWSNAYFSPNPYITALSINPVQNLYDTYAFSLNPGFDEEQTRRYYDVTADYLGVLGKDAQKLNFARQIPGAKDGPKNYNVVVIIMESYSMDKSSFINPELDTTPRSAELAKRGVLFTNFFTPTTGTARGVFTTMTGLPDTSPVETASRNPALARQHMLLNDLKGYAKFYIIGGSASWGNIRGMLSHNIDGLNLIEEGAFEGAGRTDVWGLSDLDMLRYSAKILGRTKQPFAAVLQTAGFHRPYTIPKDHGAFELKEQDEDLLKAHGFSGNEEYNSLRFEDYSLGEFFDIIENEPFYKNTIFLIFGDHALNVQESKNYPPAALQLGLTANHTPLIIIAPGLAPGVDDKPAGQTDIMATIGGLLGLEHTAAGIGRNVFDKNSKRGAFILGGGAAVPYIGYIQDGYYYVDWPNKKGLFKYAAQDADTDYCLQKPQLCRDMAALTQGLYQASRWITFHRQEAP